jgi:hypothetical protein
MGVPPFEKGASENGKAVPENEKGASENGKGVPQTKRGMPFLQKRTHKW